LFALTLVEMLCGVTTRDAIRAPMMLHS